MLLVQRLQSTAASVAWAQVSAQLLDAFLHLFGRGVISGEDDWEAIDIGPRWEAPSTVSKTLLTTARLSGVLRELLDVVRRCGIGADRFLVVQVPRELFARCTSWSSVYQQLHSMPCIAAPELAGP